MASLFSYKILDNNIMGHDLINKALHKCLPYRAVILCSSFHCKVLFNSCMYINNKTEYFSNKSMCGVCVEFSLLNDTLDLQINYKKVPFHQPEHSKRLYTSDIHKPHSCKCLHHFALHMIITIVDCGGRVYFLEQMRQAAPDQRINPLTHIG